MQALLASFGRRLTKLERRITPLGGAGGGATIDGIPVGTVASFASSFSPGSSWLLADGSAVSRLAYPALFAALGTSFGPGDGSTTFNLPNMVGSFPYGAAETATGQTGGAASHTHPLSDAGNAAILITTGADSTIEMRRVTSESSNVMNLQVPIEQTESTSTSSYTYGSGLNGTTDAASSLPPYVGLVFFVKALAAETSADKEYSSLAVLNQITQNGGAAVMDATQYAALQDYAATALNAVGVAWANGLAAGGTVTTTFTVTLPEAGRWELIATSEFDVGANAAGYFGISGASGTGVTFLGGHRDRVHNQGVASAPAKAVSIAKVYVAEPNTTVTVTVTVSSDAGSGAAAQFGNGCWSAIQDL